ncbi:MAG: cold shock domain-containing protein [Phaeodactylibacter sp.]|nr:cold shock domain-containing protein [Phaeodactylibacter sp.]
MGKSQQTFSKKEREKKRRKKKKDKLERREQRKLEKEERGKLTFEEQLSYLDENGNLVPYPPDPKKKNTIKVEDIVLGVPPNTEPRTGSQRSGTVDAFLPEKGYGFILEADTKARYFVHITEAYDAIKSKDRVSFEVEKRPKGPKAMNVKLAN